MLCLLWFTEFAHEYKHQQECCGCQKSIKFFNKISHIKLYELCGFWFTIMQNVFREMDTDTQHVLCKFVATLGISVYVKRTRMRITESLHQSAAEFVFDQWVFCSIFPQFFRSSYQLFYQSIALLLIKARVAPCI